MNLKIGFGTDLHRLVADSAKTLIIGGVEIPSKKGILAHSDGDVLLHAIVDALLGACGLGDIGDLFPDTDNLYKDKNFSFFLMETLKILKEQNYKVINLDCVIHLEKPKLNVFKLQIRDNIAGLLNMESCSVNIKAKTREKLDAVGAGEAIEAHAIVLIAKET